MNLKNLIKDTERDLFDIKNSQNPNPVNLAQIRINIRKQTVEAVDRYMSYPRVIAMFKESYKDWQKLKELLDIK